MKATAQRFAARGYVAASVAYFGVPGTPTTLVDVPVEIGGQAVQAIGSRPGVDPSRVAVMGSSKGGEYALLVASTYPEVKAVIAYVPAPFAFFGLGERSMPTGCSWSRNGKMLPCLPPDRESQRLIGQKLTANEPLSFRNSYEAPRANTEALRTAFFALERIAGPVLCLAAGDDQMWDSHTHCEMAIAYLREHGHAFTDRTITYPDAGHLFIAADRQPSSAVQSVRAGSFVVLFGGSAEADARASQAMWPQIFAFLDDAFRQPARRLDDGLPIPSTKRP